MKQRSQPNPRNRALERPNVDGIHIRAASVDDAEAIAEIYNQGIEDRVATFETALRSAEHQRAWLIAIAGRYPGVVAQIDGEIIGRAGAGPYRERECYRGIGEFSMYVWREWRGLSSAKPSAWGCGNCYHGSFRSSEASRALCRKHGFREVGVYEKHARLDGRWLDVVIVERLIFANLNVVSL